MNLLCQLIYFWTWLTDDINRRQRVNGCLSIDMFKLKQNDSIFTHQEGVLKAMITVCSCVRTSFSLPYLFCKVGEPERKSREEYADLPDCVAHEEG